MEPNDSSAISPLHNTSDFPFIDGAEEFSNSSLHKRAQEASNGHPDKDSVAKNAGILSIFGKHAFSYLLAASVIKLSIFLNKLYQDGSAVGKYYTGREINYCIVSAVCLFLPALIYIVYIVSAYVKDQVEEAESKEVGTRVVHGLLLVPWQIKGRVEVLQFSAQRICQRRMLTQKELDEKYVLERQASVLEFFAEFYAGLTQLLLQLYIIILSLNEKIEYRALTGEIIASGLTLMSMLAAVKRKDDGILTGTLSYAGWLSIMASRSICIALVTTVLHGWIVLACVLHGLLVTLWVYSIAVRTYIEESQSAKFSCRRKTALFSLIFTVFGLPSLTYWPIMFELKKRKRPLIFLFLMLVESVLMVGTWYYLKKQPEWTRHDYVLVSLAAGFHGVGTLFILFYICCKPKYTDHVVYHDMKVKNADSFGMYFDFCDVAFKLRRKEDVETKLKEIREHRIVAS